MTRFYVPPEHIHGNAFILTGPEARHAALVLRKKAGDTIRLFDGRNLSFEGRIERLSRDRVEGTILVTTTESPQIQTDLTLYQALIKGPRWDWLVEKACEIGVSCLVPLITVRTIMKPRSPEVPDRWERISIAAAKQCGRTRPMAIKTPRLLETAFKETHPDSLTLIPWEKESARTIREACRGHRGPVQVFVGPEGGWENGEVELATRHGAISVGLGPYLLRSETAGIIASTLALAEMRDYA